MPRKLRLANACGEIVVPPSVGALAASSRKAGFWNAPMFASFGSEEVQSTMPSPTAAKPTIWFRAVSPMLLVV